MINKKFLILKKIDNSFKKYVKDYVEKNSIRIYASFLIVILAYLLPRVSILQFIFVPTVLIPVSIFLIFLILNLSPKFTSFVILILFILAPILVLTQKNLSSDIAANTAFFLIWFVIFRGIFLLRK